MHLSINLFNPSWRETLIIATLLKKADILFAVSALSDSFFDNNEDKHAYMQVIEEYFVDSGDEMEAKRKMKMVLYTSKNFFN